MQYLTFVAVILAALVVGAPLSRRDAFTIEANIFTLNQNIEDLDDAVDGFGTETTDTTNVTTRIQIVDSAFNTATATILASDSLDPQDSGNITDSTSGLTEIIPGTLAFLVDKGSQIAASGGTDTVVSELTTLRTDAAAFSSALETKTTAADAPTVAFNAAINDKAFASAIAAFS